MRSILVGLTVALLAAPAITGAQDNDSILVDEYIVSQEFVEAEVIGVRVRDRILRVRGANRGDAREFKVPEGTRITVEGRQARLGQLRRGDKVLLVVKPEAEEIVISRVRVPQTDTPVDARRADPAPAPTMLPKTASFLPAVLMFGIFSLIGALATRLIRRR